MTETSRIELMAIINEQQAQIDRLKKKEPLVYREDGTLTPLHPKTLTTEQKRCLRKLMDLAWDFHTIAQGICIGNPMPPEKVWLKYDDEADAAHTHAVLAFKDIL